MTMLKSFTQVRHGFAGDATRTLESNPPTKDTRWVIGGMMGSGKTSLAKRLASAWDIPHIEIDRFASRDDLVRFTIALQSGWVAEANPWQVPEEIWSRADWVVFLDFDNIVNYWRLIRRGLARWISSGQPWCGFRKHIIDDAIKDWCRIVYLYGEANRNDWRRSGMGSDEASVQDRCLRCISPAEVELLCSMVLPRWIPSWKQLREEEGRAPVRPSA